MYFNNNMDSFIVDQDDIKCLLSYLILKDINMSFIRFTKPICNNIHIQYHNSSISAYLNRILKWMPSDIIHIINEYNIETLIINYEIFTNYDIHLYAEDVRINNILLSFGFKLSVERPMFRVNGFIFTLSLLKKYNDYIQTNEENNNYFSVFNTFMYHVYDIPHIFYKLIPWIALDYECQKNNNVLTISQDKIKYIIKDKIKLTHVIIILRHLMSVIYMTCKKHMYYL